ncbi:MAG: molybdopterin-guanine dinucleotide biosynthesis protein B [Beijerinckiaceae bacterium]
MRGQDRARLAGQALSQRLASRYAHRMRIIGITGWSGAGKTTLILKLIPLLTERGLKVSTLKHAHHMFDVDTPGKDSFEHRSAGATEVLIASANRFALMHELRGDPEPPLELLLEKLSAVDLVLIEGFKRAPHPKIEVHRAANGKPFLYPGDPAIMAVASDTRQAQPAPPWIALDDAGVIVEAVLTHAVAPTAVDWRRG